MRFRHYIVLFLFTCLALEHPIDVAHMQPESQDTIIRMVKSPVASEVAILRYDGRVEIVDIETSELLHEFAVEIPFRDPNRYDPRGYFVELIAYSPNGAHLAVSMSDYGYFGLIYVIDIAAGQVRLAHQQSDIRRVNDLSWSPDSGKLVVALQYGTVDQSVTASVEIFDVGSGSVEAVLAEGSWVDTRTASAVAWGPTNLIAYAIGNQLVLWDATTEQEIASLSSEFEVRNLAWSPNGSKLAALRADRAVQIWTEFSTPWAPSTTFSVVTENFISRVFTWIDESRLAVNVWTSVEIWNALQPHLDEVITTDNWIPGIAVLPDNAILMASPSSIVERQLNEPLHTVPIQRRWLKRNQAG
jgi:WD40 repeat protein